MPIISVAVGNRMPWVLQYSDAFAALCIGNAFGSDGKYAVRIQTNPVDRSLTLPDPSRAAQFPLPGSTTTYF
jgi:hypothetical protein